MFFMKKGLFKSKIFLLALAGLLLAVYQFFTGHPAPDGSAEQIAAIDWTNVGQGLLSLGVILARAFFSGTAIGGSFGGRLFG